MVSFISGRASSGKTYEVYKIIEKSAENKENVILIVPEQFSFETERAMLNLLGESALNYVSVLPFSRLYETVGRIKGGICGKVLTNADKQILMNRAITAVSDDLTLWGKFAHSTHFSVQMLQSIDEFKYSGINSTDLKELAEKVNDKKLKSKLSDTALIFESYVSILGTAFIDPSDFMDRLYYMLEDCDFFTDKSVFFDGFKSFSGQQFKIINRIVSKAENVLFTFLDDKKDKRNFSLLTNVRKTKNRVLRILDSNGIILDEDIFLEGNYYKNKELECLENSLFYERFTDKSEKNSIAVCEAETVYDEAEFTARNIRKIVREEGAHFSDFVVIARDTSQYEDALAVAAKRNNINIFIDKKASLSSMPISSLVVSAIEYTKKPEAKYIFDFYKTGIAGVDYQDISELEEYCIIWNIKAKDFGTDWDMNPLGLTDTVPDDIENVLNRLNSLRLKVIKPLSDFKADFKGSPKQRATAIYNLLEAVEAQKNLSSLAEYYKGESEFEYADILRQSYSQFISMLDKVVDCFSDTSVGNLVFFDALKNVLSLNSVGVVPQTLDEVVFGSAERIRPAKPKYVFVLGANQGIYPRIKVPSGLFSNTDISVLKNSGLEIEDKTIDLAIDEQMLIYSNLCCASDKVFITYCKNLPDNSSVLPSRFVTQICKLNVKKVNEPDVLSADNLPETLDSAVIEFYKRRTGNSGDSEVILNAIKEKCDERSINLDLVNISAENYYLSNESIQKIYGNKVTLSATTLETYSKCKFRHFCRYIARADNPEKAEISSVKRGTIIHYVLEKIITEYKDSVKSLNETEISAAIDKYCNEYFAAIPGYKSAVDERTKYVVYSIKRTLKEIVLRIAMEFDQSMFKPVGCEVKISENSDISVVNEINDGYKVVLNGSVDRVDAFGDYIRIVDYKTGTKKFELYEILAGINMQMLIYLYAILKSKKYGEIPAGVLYSKSERIKNEKDCPTNGLIVSDLEIVTAMEKENNGSFIPKLTNRPSKAYISAEDFSKVLRYVNEKLNDVGKEIISGDISAMPVYIKGKGPCEYCDFKGVCRIDGDVRKVSQSMDNKKVLEILAGGDNNAV